MELQISTTKLLNELNKVVKVIDTKSANPSLLGVLIDAQQDQIVLTTSNSNYSIQTVITEDFEVTEEGTFLIDGKLLLEYVKKIKKGTIDIKSDGSLVKFKSGRSKLDINTISTSDMFPQIDFNDTTGTHIQFEKNKLIDIIKNTSYAVSTRLNRPTLCGINITLKDQQIKFVSTDSYRLKMITYHLDSDDQMDVIVPAKPLLDSLNIMDSDESEMIDTYYNDGQMLLKNDVTKVKIRTIAGVFPSVIQIVQSVQVNKQVTVDKEEMEESLDRIDLLSSETDDIIKFSIKNDEMKIYVAGTQRGNIEETILCESDGLVSGEEFNIAINIKYLKEAINHLTGTKLTYNFNSNLKPFTVETEEKNYEENVSLILPVRTY